MDRRNFISKFTKFGACLPLVPFFGHKGESKLDVDSRPLELQDRIKLEQEGFRPLVNDPNNVISDAYFCMKRNLLAIYWKPGLPIDDIGIQLIERPGNSSMVLRVNNLEPMYIHLGIDVSQRFISVVAYKTSTLLPLL